MWIKIFIDNFLVMLMWPGRLTSLCLSLSKSVTVTLIYFKDKTMENQFLACSKYFIFMVAMIPISHSHYDCKGQEQRMNKKSEKKGQLRECGNPGIYLQSFKTAAWLSEYAKGFCKYNPWVRRFSWRLRAEPKLQRVSTWRENVEVEARQFILFIFCLFML